MTDQQELFVKYYCGQAKGCAARAAELAGYSHPKQNGWRLKQEPDVRAAIDDFFAAHSLSAAEILARWTDVADATQDDFYTVELGRDGERMRYELDLAGASKVGKMHLVKQIKETKYGTQILLHDKMTALACLARAKGVLTDLPAKKMEELLDAILNALPDDLREQVRQHVADALAQSPA